MKRLVRYAMALCTFVLAVSCLVPGQALAASTTVKYTWIKAGKKVYEWAEYDRSPKNGTLVRRPYAYGWIPGEYPLAISGLRNSNSAVLGVDASAAGEVGWLKYKLKKTGSATLTYRLTKSGGQPSSKTVTERHKIVSYKNPVKTFKVGSKNYASKLKKKPTHNVKGAISGKVRVKAASGWKIVKIRKVKSDFLSGELASQKKVKNGGKVSIARGSGALEVICYNKKGKYYSSVILLAGISESSFNHMGA
jgi:hypothetical protein